VNFTFSATRRRAVAAAAAILLIAAAAPAHAAEDTAAVSGHVTYNDAPATGGCVEVYDLEFELVASTCALTEGDYSITGLAPGEYLLWFTGFDGAANAYWTGGEEFAKTAVLAAGDSLTADVVLERGGTLTGRFSRDADDIPSGYATLITANKEFVDRVELDANSFYTFTHVPEGTYFVRLDEGDTYAGGWVRANYRGERLAIQMPAGTSGDADWTVSTSYSFVWDPYGAITGNLNVPKSFTSGTTCAVAMGYYNHYVFARDCGARGSEFQLDEIPLDPGQPLVILLVDGPSYVGKYTLGTHVAYYGNARAYDEQFDLSLPAEHVYYLPVFFFTDVTTRTVGNMNIQWMGDAGISRGYADGSYRPSNSVIRKHMASFLWNLMGRPDVTLPESSPFVDVDETDTGYLPMVWLKQEGITTASAYAPNNSVTRLQMALFLYRLAGSPDVTLPAKSPFADVKPGASGYTALVWMSQTGISQGYGDGTYRPSTAVTRGQMATFMAKYDQNVPPAGTSAAVIAPSVLQPFAP
jgi:hypothetical protein